MKTRTSSFLKAAKSARLVARFGSAKLVRNGEGRFELRGGSREQLLEAREWASLFEHAVVL